MSLIRQNYAEECEAAVNRQIHICLNASYVYSAMAFHFDRDDVALPGFHEFFKKLSDKQRDYSEKLMKYQNTRGGRILLQDVKKPEVNEWGSGLDAVTSALKLQKTINQTFNDLHHIAEHLNDAQLGDFIEDDFLADLIDSLKCLSDYATQLNLAGPGLGEYLFDKETLQGHK